MNNSKLIETENTLDETLSEEQKAILRARQEKNAKIIEAIDSISQSEYWKVLEDEVFKVSLDSAINQLCVEKDSRQVAWLQGKVEVLTKYANFKAFSEMYRLELKGIEKKLNN